MGNILERKKNIDMTSGNIFSLVWQYSFPLIVGDIFQQLYNLADAWVIGNYASKTEYAAMGATTFVINIIIKSVIGIAAGAGVVISKNFGAKDKSAVEKGSWTAVILGLICSVVFSIAGILFIPTALHITNIDDELFFYAKQYLTIIISFATVQIVYNMAASILRAVGDSKKPVINLSIATIVNVILDLLFVIKFNLGIKGVAYATVIAQGIAAGLTVIELCSTDLDVKLNFKKIVFDKAMCKEMLSIGIPTALQGIIVSFGNLYIQRFIVGLGTDCIAGFTTYHKVESVLFALSNSFSIASMTFVSQNLGAKNIQRAREGLFKSVVVAVVSSQTLAILITIFAPQISAWFIDDPAVLEKSIYCLRDITPWFFACAAVNTMFGGMRGAGKATVTTIVHICSNVIFRIIYLTLMTKYVGYTISIVNSAYPLGWALGTTAIIILFFILFPKVEKNNNE